MRELELNPSLFHQLKQHGRQLRRAMRKWKTSKPGRLVIDPKTVLVVDEASMVGTSDMLMLTKAAARGGGKLLLVGDQPQLPSIDAGGPFGSIAGSILPVRLHNVVRQSDHGDRAAVKAMSTGQAKQALANYVEKNQVTVAETRSELFAELMSDWKKQGGIAEPRQNVICAALNREVGELNDLAQALRLHAGAIDPTQKISIHRKGSRFEPAATETFCLGDRVTVTKKSRKYGVENGDTGTLTGISRTRLSKTISVLFDDETTPRILPLRKVPVRRGYAFTTHKLQGGTADNVYVAMTGPMLNLQMAYVQMSRHRHLLNLYVPEHLAEKDLLKTVERRKASLTSPELIAPQSDLRSVLSNLMAKDAGKDLAHDVIKNDVPATSHPCLTREEAERLLQSFAQLGDLHIAKGARTLDNTIIANWQTAGGATQPEQHRMFAQSEADRHVLNHLAQKSRQESGLLDPTRSMDAGDSTLLVGDHIRFESDLKKCRIAAGTTAKLVDIKGAFIQVQCFDSQELVAVPKHLVRASLGYALPSKDMPVTLPKTAHVRLSERFDDEELSHVYRSLHREKCRLYVSEAAAGQHIRAAAKTSTPTQAPTPPSPQFEFDPPQHARKKVIRHG